MRRTGIALLAAVGLAVVAFAPAAVAAPKTYTAAQVAKHSSASSCWTIVGKNVYDVTKYVAKHPGGASVIKAMCGKDGSAMFRGQHAGEQLRVGQLRVGQLRVEQLRVEQLRVGQLRVGQLRIERHRDHGRDRGAACVPI